MAKKKNKKPSILSRNEPHFKTQLNTRATVTEDKSKRIPRKNKHKKNTRDYL